jgi:glycine amidinotransferase
MKVNCYNTFDKLEEMVLGSLDFSVLDGIPNLNKRNIMQDVLYQTDSDFNDIVKILNGFGTKVHRPDCSSVDFSKTYKTPFYELSGIHIPLSPRDIIFIAGDEICLMSSGDRTRFFEHLFYKNVLEYYEDSHIISMPMPRLHDDLYFDADDRIEDSVKNHCDYFNNSEPLLDAANIQMYGKDIFVTSKVSANDRGIQWLQKYCNKNQYRLHVLGSPFNGHIDTHFNILRPGLVLSYFDKKHLPEFFKNWTVIQTHGDPRVSDHESQLITENIQDDDFSINEFSCNVISLDPNTVLIYEWLKNTKMVKELEKHKITPVFAPMKYCHFINQGFKCITLDTVRKGTLEDYLV